MTDRTKSIIKAWVVILLSGTIGIAAFAWIGHYEKGSVIDHIMKSQEARK